MDDLEKSRATVQPQQPKPSKAVTDEIDDLLDGIDSPPKLSKTRRTASSAPELVKVATMTNKFALPSSSHRPRCQEVFLGGSSSKPGRSQSFADKVYARSSCARCSRRQAVRDASVRQMRLLGPSF
jgi:hypothetical protein